MKLSKIISRKVKNDNKSSLKSTGWLKTFDNYYKTQTKAIFTNMMEKLPEGIGRKFIWAEISYLSMWWASDASDKEKAILQK